LTDEGVFSSSINNDFEFINTPLIYKVTPYKSPLTATINLV
jgi:hypothetical protein